MQFQGIYSFRGADSSIMKKLIDDPDWTVIKLYKNYRSCKEVCSYANKNTRYASEKYRIELNPEKSDDGEVHVDHFEQHDYELFPEDTLEDIVVDITDRQKYGNVALLARSNKEVAELKTYLKSKNIEFVSHNRNEDAIRFLRASGNNEYFMDWVTTQLNSEQYARYVRLHTIENPENDVRDFYNKFSTILRIKYIMDTVSMIRVKFRDPTLTNVLKANEILKLIGIDERDHDFKLNDYSMTELYDYLVNAVQEETKSDIYVGTIHSVKGLEFNHVFVVGMEEGIFPHMNSLMETSELEEERRLCYVAITRAKDDLHLINARRRTLFGKEQINPVSRFIGEISKDLIETNVKEEELPQQEKKIDTEVMFREEEVDYQVGDYVYHETFGTGRVVEVTNTLVSVAFKHPHGIKKLMKNHKKLSKV